MKLLQLIGFLAILIFTQNSYSFVKDGKICNTMKHGGYKCHDPISQQALESEQNEDNYYSLLNACEFSMLKTWSGEIERFNQSIKTSNMVIDKALERIYWAEQDVKKQNYLPSDTIQSAIRTIERNEKTVAMFQEKLQTQEWCLACAKIEKSGVSKGIMVCK